MTDKTQAVSLFTGSGKIALTGASSMAEALKTSAADDPRGNADAGQYMNFSGKRGVYEIGTEKNNADPDELWLVNIASFESGFVCWKGGNPVAKRYASIYGTPVPVPDYAEHGPFDPTRGEGWFVAKTMVVRSLDRGEQAYFAINSKSGVSVFAQLQKEIAMRAEAGDPAWPIISFDCESFAAQGNKNYKPKFVQFGWLGDAQINFMATQETIDDAMINNLCDDADKGVTDYGDSEPEPEFDLEDEAEVAEEVEAEVAEEVEAAPAPAPASRSRARASAKETTKEAPKATTRRRASV